MSRAPAAPAARSARIAVFCCSVLVLLLPTVVVGASIAVEAGADERARLMRIVGGRHHKAYADSQLSRWFHTASVPTSTWPVHAAEQRALVVAARRSQVFGVTALSLLTYLSVLLAGGRLRALLACAILAGLPPIASSGHVLRPETPATVFALLAVVLLQVAMRPPPRRQQRRPRHSRLSVFGLMACAAVAIAFAVETMPSLGEALLVPGVVLLLASAQLLLRTLRSLRRRGLAGTPVRAVNRRLLPWTALALAAPALSLWLLDSTLTVSVDEIAITERTSELLPAVPAMHTLCVALLVIGASVMVARLGLRLGRGGRIGAELVLFAFCAVFLVKAAVGDGRSDPLPRAPAAAIVLSEAVAALLVVTLGWFSRRRAR